VNDIIDHAVVKVLDQFDVHLDLIKRWSGLSPEAPS
jgi:3-polyprenyl-4-hydroxybenzoate decarboxylase